MPLGVVAVVYEARPNVTVDAAALCLKSGNAIVLRGSSSAAHSNAVLADRIVCLSEVIPAGAVSLVSGGREQLAELAGQEGVVDLIIPRGGEGLKKALSAVAKVPVIYAASGNCHVYVDASSRPRRRHCGSCSTPRPSARASATPPRRCSSTPTPPREFLPAAGARCARPASSCAPRSAPPRCSTARAGRRNRGGLRRGVPRARPRGQGRRLGRGGDRARQPLRLGPFRGDRDGQRRRGAGVPARVDAACVYVNASTRFTDGGEFGMGAEIGNSTQKLHARGPIGLRELCTFKYLVEGDGQVRP